MTSRIVVLDQDDGDAAVTDTRDNLVELLGFMRVHASGRSSSSSTAVPRRERARELKPALVAV
jgi:hypothetical protein